MQLTLKEVERKQKKGLTRLIKVAGSSGHLARMLNCSPQRTKNWEIRELISKDGAREVIKHRALKKHGFTLEELRPDMYKDEK